MDGFHKVSTSIILFVIKSGFNFLFAIKLPNVFEKLGPKIYKLKTGLDGWD
jgi:hypothetical protein